MTQLSVILPCYNEAQAIQAVIADWNAQAEDLKASLGLARIELLIVDDGSEDGSCDFLEISQLHETSQPVLIKVLRHSKNMGYGQSLKTGLLNAQGDWVAFHDCDGTCSATDLKKLWQKKDEADLVVGQRITDHSHMPLLRRFGNLLYQFLFRIFFRQAPHDLCSGYRLFHKKWAAPFQNELPNQLNFTLAMSLWMTLNKYKVVQVPITYEERLGESKLSTWIDGWRFLFTILRYRFLGLRNKSN